MKKLLFIFLLFPSLLWAAQVITIVQGTTIYGPFSVTNPTTNRYASMQMQRTNNTFTSLTVTLVRSTDSCKTATANQTDSRWLGTTVFLSGGTLPAPMGTMKNFPRGTGSICVIATAVGGSVTISQVPTVNTK